MCNGTNACVDCKGVPNGGATIDCCGVCGGDGTSCPELCKTYNVRAEKKRTLKSISLLLKGVVKYSDRERACDKSRQNPAKQRVKRAREVASKAESLVKTSILDTFKLCNTPFCAKTDQSQTLRSVKSALKTLYKLSQQSQYGAGAACKTPPTNSGGSGKTKSLLTTGTHSLGGLPSQHCVN